jgi:nucleolar protein 56
MNRCKLVLLESGVIALDDNNRVIDALKFDRADMVNEYTMIKKGIVSNGLDSMLESLKAEGYTTILCNDDSLVNLVEAKGLKASMLSKEERLGINESKVTLMLDANIARDEHDALALLHDFAVAFSSQKIAEVSSKADLHIIQCINAIDELDKMINILSARIREWYGLHFPELEGLVQSINSYADIIIRLGYRDSISINALKQLKISDNENKLRAIVESARSSKGGIISKSNIDMLKMLAEEVKRLDSIRDTLTKHLEYEMEHVAPNIKDILGSTIGARMIAKVGGLDKLAVLPASTIQVLGAEKALFRALKTGTRPPKHGILFQHSLVHSSPRWQRGKIARVLATKVALAARVDAYSGIRDPSIVKKLQERIDEIRAKYKEPTAKSREADKKRVVVASSDKASYKGRVKNKDDHSRAKIREDNRALREERGEKRKRR